MRHAGVDGGPAGPVTSSAPCVGSPIPRGDESVASHSLTRLSRSATVNTSKGSPDPASFTLTAPRDVNGGPEVRIGSLFLGY
jgi:hypothetical protein